VGVDLVEHQALLACADRRQELIEERHHSRETLPAQGPKGFNFRTQDQRIPESAGGHRLDGSGFIRLLEKSAHRSHRRAAV
jgi:hypothetical protein